MAVENWNGTQEQQNALWEASEYLDRALEYFERAKSLFNSTVSDMDAGENCGTETHYHADQIKGMNNWGCSDDLSELSSHIESVASSIVVFDPDATDGDDDEEENGEGE